MTVHTFCPLKFRSNESFCENLPKVQILQIFSKIMFRLFHVLVTSFTFCNQHSLIFTNVFAKFFRFYSMFLQLISAKMQKRTFSFHSSLLRSQIICVPWTSSGGE